MRRILSILFVLTLITIISCGGTTETNTPQDNDNPTSITNDDDTTSDEVGFENTSDVCAETEAKGFDGICKPRSELGLLGEMSDEECEALNEGLSEEESKYFNIKAEYREDGCIKHCVDAEKFFLSEEGPVYTEENCLTPNTWVETGLEWPPDHCATPDMQLCETISNDDETVETTITNCISMCDDMYTKLIEYEFSPEEAYQIIDECKEGCAKSESCDQFCAKFCSDDSTDECTEWCSGACEE